MPDQDQINDMEWQNPNNWSSGIYFSKYDSRVWVPKQRPWMGMTLNVGHPAGARWLIGIFAGIILILTMTIVLMAFLTPKISSRA